MRTPEGHYLIVGRKDGVDIHERYGPLAFVLNYPNDEDRRAGRGGQGIWIHGTDSDSAVRFTHGCLALDNKDLLELAAVLGPGIGTPVLIVDKESLERPAAEPAYAELAASRAELIARYARDQEQFVQVLDEWKKAWEAKDMQRYEACYSTTDFIGQGMNWNAWRERKQRTFGATSVIAIGIEHVLLADCSPSEAIVKFVQTYTSDALHVLNGKKLSFVRIGGQWKIRREETFPKEELVL
jgi:murein L,D-transpeptidase YafK